MKKRSLTDRFKRNPTKSLTLIIATFIGSQVVESIFGDIIQNFFKNEVWSNDVFINYFLPVVFGVFLPVLIILILFYTLFKEEKGGKKEEEEDINLANQNSPGFFFGRSDSIEFHTVADKLLSQASRVVLIGMGLNILHRDPIRVALLERAKEGELYLEIFLANPNSPSVQDRLIEEELGNEKPPVGKTGLINRLRSLSSDVESFKSSKHISLKLFSNYPTFALMIIDSEYFFYPYGFAKLGNYSPVFQLSRKNKKQEQVIAFLDDQYNKIKESSKDASSLFTKNTLEEHSFEIGIFFIPDKESSIYSFGTQVLGYDIRKKESSESIFLEENIGAAKAYGFHLTIGDILFFHSKSEIERCVEEVEFIAKQLKPFKINILPPKQKFPNVESVSLLVKDIEGGLEILHSEFVHRIYNRAFGSNYTNGNTAMDRSSRATEGRDKAIKLFYKAPYILKSYTPHFTLLSNIDGGKKENQNVISNLMAKFSKSKVEKLIIVDKIAIVTRDHKSKFWTIRKEIGLE